MFASSAPVALRFVRVQAPALEPVLLADVKLHCRIDAGDTSQDALLGVYIAAARRYAEGYTGRSFIQQKWRAVADSFPGCFQTQEFFLHHGPLISVETVKYLDPTGALATLDAGTYAVDASGLLPRVAPAFGKAWPASLPQVGAVTIDYTAGYGSAATDVPETLRHWILLRISAAFEHRGEVEMLGSGDRLQPMPFVDGMLDSEKESVL